MSIEEDLSVVLQPVAKAYPFVAPDNVAPPYITYFAVVSIPENTLSSGVSIINTRFQIDVFGKTYASMKTLVASLVTAMSAAPFKNVQLSRQEFYEQELRIYRMSLDYSVWHY